LNWREKPLRALWAVCVGACRADFGRGRGGYLTEMDDGRNCRRSKGDEHRQNKPIDCLQNSL